MERVRLVDPDVREQVTFLARVDLGLRAGDDLEASLQPSKRVVVAGEQLVLDPRPDRRQVHLHPLVVAGEAVLGNQPFVDDAAPERDVASQPCLASRTA